MRFMLQRSAKRSSLGFACLLVSLGAVAQQSMHSHDDTAHEIVSMTSSHAMPDDAMHEMVSMSSMTAQPEQPAPAMGSGTSWQPALTPHPAGWMGQYGAWQWMSHAEANLIANAQGGPRGDREVYLTSMTMLMAHRLLGPGQLTLVGMGSLDPLMGKSGYPLLFQTGETADGAHPLIDRQHPHDLIMALSARYSVPLNDHQQLFGYVGLPGEPALGPSAFMHRFSGQFNPEAPLSHHWQDSTHITFGVVTAGFQYRNWQLEASAFRGREPDQHRYNIETGPLDSNSVRLSWNPSPHWSAQVSRGYLNSPEQLAPDEDVTRTTASVSYQDQLQGSPWQGTLVWGRNAAHGSTSDAWLAEWAWQRPQGIPFARLERVDTHGLLNSSDSHDLDHTHAAMISDQAPVTKLSVGYLKPITRWNNWQVALGGLLSGYQIAAPLKAAYDRPYGGQVWLRFTPVGHNATQHASMVTH